MQDMIKVQKWGQLGVTELSTSFLAYMYPFPLLSHFGVARSTHHHAFSFVITSYIHTLVLYCSDWSDI